MSAPMLPLERLTEIEARFSYLEARLAEAPPAAELAELSREYERLKPVVSALAAWRKALAARAEAEALAEADPELRPLADEERARIDAELPALERALKRALLPQDAADPRPAILEIRPGAGGEEAALFAADLLRMYTRYAERRGFSVELISLQETELGGVREAVLRIAGEGVFARLKHESGVHRVQRVPVTESGGRIHTSTATVAVLPEADEIDLEIPESELRIETMRASGAGGQHVNTTDSAVRITHLPTGITVTSALKSQHQNRRLAMEVLRARLFDLKRREEAQARAEARRAQVGTGDRSERIRTYNFPQGRVTDHRIGLTLHALPEILEGDLDPLIEPLIAAAEARALAEADTP